MKQIITKLTVAGTLLLASSAVLAELTTNVLITNVGGDLRNNALISIELSKNIRNGVCERNNVLFLDPSDSTQKALIAVAITTKIQETPVVLIDSGTCTDTFNGSTVGKVALMKG